MLLTLHALRLKGLAETDVVAGVWHRDPAVVAAELAAAGADGLVLRRDGRMPGWMLTAAGRAHGEGLLRAELDDAGAREVVEESFGRFLSMNQPFLDLCTDWQLRTVDGEHVVNDHLDADHDAAVLARLGAQHRALRPLAERLAASLARFERYPRATTHAHDATMAGDTDWFCRPVIESYHTVWFELHEDLLATLGRRRNEEGA